MGDENNKKHKKNITKRMTPFGYEYKCERCGEWIPMYSYDHNNYAYKIYTSKSKILFFCSWTCMRAYEENSGAKRFNTVKGRKKYLPRNYNDK